MINFARCKLADTTMKKGIHPEDYRLVVFKDMSNEYSFLGKSTTPTDETVKWEDGNEYPLIKLEISHKSHPFFTGKMQFVDTAGRIDKFKNKYKRHLDKKPAEAAAKPEPAAEEKPAETAGEGDASAEQES